MAIRKEWRKIGGGTLTLVNGKTVKSGEKFYAFEQEIPDIFKKQLELLGDAPKANTLKATNKSSDSDASSSEASTEKVTVKNPSKTVKKQTTANKSKRTTKRTQSKK